MNQLLRRLKLIDNFTIEIEIEKSNFITKLKANVDPGDTGIFFSAFEVFSSSRNEYKGSVEYDGFEIRKRRKFFDMSLNIAIAKGKYQQKDHLLEIDAEVNGFHGMFIPFYIFVPIFYIIFISSALIGDTGNQMWFIFPFILFHAAFMLGIPYLIMRRSVSRTKYDLERDFFYMTKK